MGEEKPHGADCNCARCREADARLGGKLSDRDFKSEVSDKGLT